LINWVVIGYLSTKNDPGAVHLWFPFNEYPVTAFGVLAGTGTLSAIFAARNSARVWWFGIAGLNAITFVLEFVSS